MPEISYPFLFIPRALLTFNFIKDPSMVTLIYWILNKISGERQSTLIRGQHLYLQPYEFVFGRDSCSEETGITPEKLRKRMEILTKLNFIEKMLSKTSNTFSVYRVNTRDVAKGGELHG